MQKAWRSPNAHNWRSFSARYHLTQVSFMDSRDAYDYAKKLEKRGLGFLDSAERVIDIAFVASLTDPKKYCDWLEIAIDRNNRPFCWLRGTAPGKIVRKNLKPESFTFFYKGHFSQFFRSSFAISEHRFSHAEQFMMYSKAMLFGDRACANKIIEATTPDEQKALGKKASGFDEEIWQLFRDGIVFTGNYAKFSQNPRLRALLIATRGTTLVEASLNDLVWGIGLSADDPQATDRSNCRGSNLLGEILCRVREVLIWEKARGL